MKTITEFTVATLKNAFNTRQDLIAAGKTPEELPAALSEALKIEGDKLTILLSALEVVEKKPNDLKRVVVWSLQEGEVPLKGMDKRGEHHFVVELFPPMPGQEKPQGRGHGKGDGKGKDRDKRGKGRGGRGGDRDGGRDNQGGRGARGPQARDGIQTATTEGGKPAEGGDGQRRRRRPSGPRRDGAIPTHAGPQTPAVPHKPIQPRATPLIPVVAPSTASVEPKPSS